MTSAESVLIHAICQHAVVSVSFALDRAQRGHAFHRTNMCPPPIFHSLSTRSFTFTHLPTAQLHQARNEFEPCVLSLTHMCSPTHWYLKVIKRSAAAVYSPTCVALCCLQPEVSTGFQKHLDYSPCNPEQCQAIT